jgi:hypothetical protein
MNEVLRWSRFIGIPGSLGGWSVSAAGHRLSLFFLFLLCDVLEFGLKTRPDAELLKFADGTSTSSKKAVDRRAVRKLFCPKN